MIFYCIVFILHCPRKYVGFLIILHRSFLINNFMAIFNEILYFFTIEVPHLGKNQCIKKILPTFLAILMCNRKNFNDSS